MSNTRQYDESREKGNPPKCFLNVTSSSRIPLTINNAAPNWDGMLSLKDIAHPQLSEQLVLEGNSNT